MYIFQVRARVRSRPSSSQADGPATATTGLHWSVVGSCLDADPEFLLEVRQLLLLLLVALEEFGHDGGDLVYGVGGGWSEEDE